MQSSIKLEITKHWLRLLAANTANTVFHDIENQI